MAVDNLPHLVFCLQEEHLCKPEAPFVVNYFKNTLKMGVHIITGDNEH